MADYGNMRKWLLLFFGVAGSIATISIGFITDPSLWWLVGILLIVTNVFYGASMVFYNAYLPLLTRSHPKYINSIDEGEKEKVYDRLSNKISQNGFLIGSISSVVVLLLCVPIAFFVSREPDYEILCNKTAIDLKVDSTVAYRGCVALSGAWWLLFTIISVPYFLYKRPGPPLLKGGYIVTSVKTVYETARKIKQLPQCGLFFIGYFISSDTYTTISSVAVIFATDELGVDGFTLSILLLLVPIAAAISIFTIGKIQMCFDLQSKILVCWLLFGYTALCFYGTLGFIPGITFGLLPGQNWEMYIVGIAIGVFLGPIQAYFRTIFTILIPKGQESEFFSFYEISDKGSSWIGPLIAAAIREYTGSMRYVLIYLGFACMISIPLVLFLDLDKGRKQAADFNIKPLLAKSHSLSKLNLTIESSVSDDESIVE